MGKITVAIVGVVLGAALLAFVIGVPLSLVFVAFARLTLAIGGDSVPVIYNVRSLVQRRVTTLVTGIGLALVSFVFATVLMLAAGVQKTLVASGMPENAKIIRKGSQTEVQSGVTPEQVRLLSSAAEIGNGPDGKPLMAGESIVLIYGQLSSAKSEHDEGANLMVRGVGPQATQLHGGVKIADGRMFTPGTSEIVIGKALVGRFRNMRLGDKNYFARRDWTVVGILDGGGSSFDSEVWGDLDQFLDAFGRRPDVSSVTMRLRDTASSTLTALETRLQSNPQLSQLEVKRETDYYADQSKGLAMFVRALGGFVAFIFSLGAILGAMITMYAQVAARTREIGTLRALGFRRRAVLVSFVGESVILGVVSSLVGLLGAMALQATSFTTTNFASFSEVTFGFTMTPLVAGASLLFGALMGYAGGLLPAMRAAFMPITKATRG